MIEFKKKLMRFYLFIFSLSMLFTACNSAKIKTTDFIEKQWELTEIDGAAVTDTDFTRTPQLFFKSDGSFGGNDGCNGMGGLYNLENEKITLSEVIGTKMFCEGAKDRLFNSLLANADKVKVLNDKLTFYTNDKIVLVFKKID